MINSLLKRLTPLLILLAVLIIFNGCQKESPVTIPNQQQQVFDLAKPSAALKAVMEVQNKHTDRLLNVNDVIGTATSVSADSKLVIKILTKSDKAKGLPSMIDGVPVVVDNIGEVRTLALTARYTRPVPIGVSIGNINECASGTLGCAIEKSGTRYILSNNHVMAQPSVTQLTMFYPVSMCRLLHNKI